MAMAGQFAIEERSATIPEFMALMPDALEVVPEHIAAG